MDYSLSNLLADVRRTGSIPASANTGSQDTDLIDYLNGALMACAAQVISVREGFFRRYKDHTLTASTRYRIPTRAIGNRLAAVLLLDGQGNVVGKLDEIPYSRVVGTASNSTQGYYLEAGDIVLAPGATPYAGATTLRMIYYIRPNELSNSLNVASGQCFTVTAVAGNVLTLMSSHGISTSTKIDILKGGPPFEHLSVDELPSATASSTVTVADGSRVEVGDFVCRADKAPVPQLPDAFMEALTTLAAMDFRNAIGDSEAGNRLAKSVEQLFKDGLGLIAPRVEDGGAKIMSNSGVLGRLFGSLRRPL